MLFNFLIKRIFSLLSFAFFFFLSFSKCLVDYFLFNFSSPSSIWFLFIFVPFIFFIHRLIHFSPSYYILVQFHWNLYFLFFFGRFFSLVDFFSSSHLRMIIINKGNDTEESLSNWGNDDTLILFSFRQTSKGWI